MDTASINYVGQKIQSNMNLIGQDPIEIRKSVETDLSIFQEACKQFSVGNDDVHYPCKVTISFVLFRGNIEVEIEFGDNHTWKFEADFWGGGMNLASGSGSSAWGAGFKHPQDGEEMHFEIVSTAAAYGCIQMFFWRENGPILGGFTIYANGAGLIGGGGTGTWKRK